MIGGEGNHYFWYSRAQKYKITRCCVYTTTSLCTVVIHVMVSTWAWVPYTLKLSPRLSAWLCLSWKPASCMGVYQTISGGDCATGIQAVFWTVGELVWPLRHGVCEACNGKKNLGNHWQAIGTKPVSSVVQMKNVRKLWRTLKKKTNP